MPMSQHDNTIQKAVNKLSENLEELPRNMRQFSSVFRDLYADQAVGGNSDAAVKFRKIRDDTRQDAMVYLKCILPATTNFIRSVKEYFENYEALSYEEWCEMLPDILEETKEHKDLAQTVLHMYQDIRVPLKKRQDSARMVMTEFSNLQTVYHLSEESPSANAARAIASEKQYKVNKNAARLVAETLIPALSRFIDGMQKVAEFYRVIEKEQKSFEDRTEQRIDKLKQSHYNVIRNSVREIKSLCAEFYAVIPDIRTDFKALPSEDTDQNYVDKWLEKTLADTRNQTTVMALLGSSSGMEEKVDKGRKSNGAPTLENKPAPPAKRPAVTPKNDPLPKSKRKPPAPPPKDRSTLTPVDVPPSKNIPAPPLSRPNRRPLSTPIYASVSTTRYEQGQTYKKRPVSDCQVSASTYIKVQPLKNGQASTPTNDPISTKDNKQAPTLKNRPASPPVDKPVPTSKNQHEKTPKGKRKTTSDDQTPLTSKSKQVSSSQEDLIERKQQRCHWRCNIM
ncbi:uncharacterized protein LOC114523181 [Dendronephthya gigantea]|uniref:uncharacterized protein LOC114523181 n=1 Tax=Dendronephthya gigantea TaxID=151771 RepID=UPI00106D75C4|nr:uncharacterized protein LOC114523181 [Dendronephthya gigantea]